MREDILIIVNPVSGPFSRAGEQHRLRSSLKALDLPLDWEETRPDRGADQIIEDSPTTGPVVVVGGDGTVQAAARALRGGDRPLVVIPRGSGNVFAHRLGLPSPFSVALQVLAEGRGRVRRCDVGLVDGEPFLLGVGVGLDASVVREADRRLKKQVGKLAYVVGAARNLPVPHHDFLLEIDGRRVEERGASVMVANFGTQIGPWIFPPEADGSDGFLDIALMKAENIEQSLSLLAAPFLPGDVENKGIRSFRGREVRVFAPERLPIQIDGEDLGDAQGFSCSIEPESLPVLVPADTRHG